jgi:hypothetical protein
MEIYRLSFFGGGRGGFGVGTGGSFSGNAEIFKQEMPVYNVLRSNLLMYGFSTAAIFQARTGSKASALFCPVYIQE